MDNNIQVAVIGKSGQAAQLISIVNKIDGVNLKWVYLPERVNSKELPLTDNFDKVLECQAVIIASPTYTHADYLRRFKNFDGYILVEKPIVSTKEETEELRGYSDSWKKRIKVNYNFQHSQIIKILNLLINNPDFGQPIALDVLTSNGLTFLEKYQSSWRANLKYSFGVLELVGTHYINLAISLFGPIKNFEAHCQWKTKKGSQLPPDTVSLILMMEKDVRVNLYHSYAGPYLNRILFIGTNGYFDYDGKIANLYSPRDSYNSEGLFAAPPILKNYQLDDDSVWQESLTGSLKDFFDVVKRKGEFSLTILERAFMAMEPIFALREKMER